MPSSAYGAVQRIPPESRRVTLILNPATVQQAMASMDIGNEDGLLIVADVTAIAGPSGTAQKAPAWAPKIVEKDGQLLAVTRVTSGTPLVYYAGGAWSKAKGEGVIIGIVGAWLQGSGWRVVRLVTQGYIQLFDHLDKADTQAVDVPVSSAELTSAPAAR